MSDNFREVYGWATTPDEAKAAAKTTAKRIERSKATLELTLPGSTAIIAGMHITLVGFRDGINGVWKVLTVRHTLSRSGYLVAITAEAAQ